jgi:hypothetical protein
MSFISTFRRSTMRLAGKRNKGGHRSGQMWPLWLICGSLVAVILVGLIVLFQEGRALRDDTPETKLAAGQDLRIALDRLVVGRIYLFSYPGDRARRIRFVLQRTSDNAVLANMASCQACYRSEHPHFTHKGRMICGMCNSRRALPMTETELRLIAAPAMIGLSSKPKKRKPVAPSTTEDRERILSKWLNPHIATCRLWRSQSRTRPFSQGM